MKRYKTPNSRHIAVFEEYALMQAPSPSFEKGDGNVDDSDKTRLQNNPAIWDTWSNDQ